MRQAPNLRRLREEAFLSQQELADRSGISKAAIHRIETGQPARLSTLRRLAGALGVAPASLVEQEQGQMKAAA